MVVRRKNYRRMVLSVLLAICVSVAMIPAFAFADDEGGQSTFKNWRTIYSELGVETASEDKAYDAVTSATEYKSSHAGEDSGAAGIPKVVNRVKDTSGNTTALDGANIPNTELKDIKLHKGSHKTFEQARPNKKYGTDEFIIEPDYTVEGWSWNNYFDTVYAVTVSDGKTTVGALPWIDFYGQKGRDTGTSGVGHYNYVEVALNSGSIPTQPTMEVHRFDSFYDNGELKSGKYTVTVYSTEYKPLVAKDIWVAARSHAEVALDETKATSSSVPMTFEKALPSDFQPVYTVDGKEATYENGTLNFDAVKPGSHAVVISSGNVDSEGNKKYLDINASFVYSVTEAVVEYDSAAKKLVSKDASIAIEDYVKTITNVKVDGKDYIPAGKGQNVAKVINEDGTIDLSKTDSKDSVKPVEFVVTATGYPELSFNTKEDIANATVTVKNGTYTGKALKPAVTVKLGDKALKSGTDYSVVYANNKNAGSGKVTVTGTGDYKGSKVVTFKINKAKNTLVAKAKTATVKYKAVKKKARTIAAKKAFKVTKAKGKVSYKKAKGNKKITVAKNGKVTVKKGLKKGTYKVQVKIKAAGNANYKAITKTVTTKIRVK